MAKNNDNKNILDMRYEEAIAQIEGTAFVTVELDENNNISNIRVVADKEFNPSDMVKDVQKIMKSKFDIDVDFHSISIVQEELSKEWAAYLSNNVSGYRYEIEEVNKKPFFPRFQLLSVNTTVTGFEMEALVKIGYRDEIFEGRTYGPKIAAGKLFLVAAATMQAVSEFLKGKALLVADEVVKSKMSQKDSVHASVTLITENFEETLIGSVFVKEDETEAASKAALDAINRRIMSLN